MDPGTGARQSGMRGEGLRRALVPVRASAPCHATLPCAHSPRLVSMAEGLNAAGAGGAGGDSSAAWLVLPRGPDSEGLPPDQFLTHAGYVKYSRLDAVRQVLGLPQAGLGCLSLGLRKEGARRRGGQGTWTLHGSHACDAGRDAGVSPLLRCQTRPARHGSAHFKGPYAALPSRRSWRAPSLTGRRRGLIGCWG